MLALYNVTCSELNPAKSPFFDANSLGYQFDSNKTSKQIKSDEMESNIFYEKDKTQENILKRNKSAFVRKNYLEKIEKQEEESKKIKQTPKSVKKSIEKTKVYDPNYSAVEMKKKDLISFNSTDERVKKIMSHAKSPPKKDNNRENIKYNLSERYGSNSKYQKQLDMSSTFQNSTFYSEASTKTEKDKEIQSFVIEANTGFDKFETKELKNLYSRNGIHIFDVSERGRLYDGNEKGKICFKNKSK